MPTGWRALVNEKYRVITKEMIAGLQPGMRIPLFQAAYQHDLAIEEIAKPDLEELLFVDAIGDPQAAQWILQAQLSADPRLRHEGRFKLRFFRWGVY